MKCVLCSKSLLNPAVLIAGMPVGPRCARKANLMPLAARGIVAHGISPKGKGAKVSAVQFAKLTGYTGRSNQHTRDAAMVAWAYRGARA